MSCQSMDHDDDDDELRSALSGPLLESPTTSSVWPFVVTLLINYLCTALPGHFIFSMTIKVSSGYRRRCIARYIKGTILNLQLDY